MTVRDWLGIFRPHGNRETVSPNITWYKPWSLIGALPIIRLDTPAILLNMCPPAPIATCLRYKCIYKLVIREVVSIKEWDGK